MAKSLLVGVMLPKESRSGIGHTACTLGGINYESRGSRGCVKGSVARGAAHPLFRHHFHLVVSDAQAARAKEYADSCVGNPYVWGAVPSDHKGGDCSGYVSGIISTSNGDKPHRLFATPTWLTVAPKLGFRPGLVSAVVNALGTTKGGTGVADRPFPGFPIEQDSKKPDHVKWIQARLNFAAHNHHKVLHGKALGVDGEFGPDTLKVVKAFQKQHGLQGLGMVGPKTWKRLNDVR